MDDKDREILDLKVSRDGYKKQVEDAAPTVLGIKKIEAMLERRGVEREAGKSIQHALEKALDERDFLRHELAELRHADELLVAHLKHAIDSGPGAGLTTVDESFPTPTSRVMAVCANGTSFYQLFFAFKGHVEARQVLVDTVLKHARALTEMQLTKHDGQFVVPVKELMERVAALATGLGVLKAFDDEHDGKPIV